MKILEVDIYGFGKLAQTKLRFDIEMQVLFGENEVGKSTVFSFIQAILFGFNSKASPGPQYEPIHVNVYGGSLTLELPNKETVKVERVKKSSGSAVKISFSDGRIGDEADLRNLLHGLDKSFFEKSYYFNLDGLRDVQNLEEDEIGKYLFYTGVSGSDKLFEIEKQLLKDTENLYKKGGRNPQINGKIAQIKQSNADFKTAISNQDRYNSLLEKKSKLIREIEDLESSLKQDQIEQGKLRMEKQLLVNSHKRFSIELRLAEIGELHFPINGLERLKDIQSELNPIEKLASEKTQEIYRLKAECSNNSYSEEIIRLEDDILKSSEVLNKVEDLNQQIQDLGLKNEEYAKQLKQYGDDLCLSLDGEVITKMDTSIFVKEEIAQLENLFNRLNNQIDELKRRQKVESEKLLIVQADLKEIESEMLTDKEVSELQRKLHNRNIAKELEEINRNIQLATLTNAQVSTNNLKLPLIIFSVVCLLLAGLMFFIGKTDAFIVSSLVSTAMLIFAFMSSKKGKNTINSKDYMGELLERKKEIEMDFIELTERELTEIEWKLKTNLELVESHKIKSARMDDVSVELGNIEKQIYESTAELDKAKNELIQLGEKFHLSEKISLGMLSKAFEKFELWKKVISEKVTIVNQLNLKNQHLDDCTQFIKNLSSYCNLEIKDNYYEIVSEMKQLLKEHKERKTLFDKNQDLVRMAEEELVKFKSSINFCVSKKLELLTLAQCENEETFLAKGELAKEKMELQKELSPILSQIGDFKFSGLDQFEIDLRLQVLNTTEEKNNCEKSEKQSELAKTILEIEDLEENGTVEKISQSLQENIESMRSEAFKWMKLKLAHGILNKTITNLKEKKLPAVVAKAEEYLEFLTDGKYKKIVFSEATPGLYLVSQNQEEVYARDLSRGTQELLYTSLRLAFAQNLNQKMSWPLLMDDTFVNFDKKRTKKVFELLSKVSCEQQIVFFTCHEHVLQYFNENNICNLNEAQLIATM
ncbi:MAG: family ATPase [Bacillales bacterium]|jgi:uncharacterized protein YhaN|nr:family ATPase [Bacillales bacterium]